MTGTDANQIGEVMMEFANSVQECPCPPSCLEVTRFRFCHIILIHMEPFDPAHRPVDVKGLTFVTFFNNFNFEGHISCFTLGNQMARDSVQGHHVVI